MTTIKKGLVIQRPDGTRTFVSKYEGRVYINNAESVSKWMENLEKILGKSPNQYTHDPAYNPNEHGYHVPYKFTPDPNPVEKQPSRSYTIDGVEFVTQHDVPTNQIQVSDTRPVIYVHPDTWQKVRAAHRSSRRDPKFWGYVERAIADANRNKLKFRTRQHGEIRPTYITPATIQSAIDKFFKGKETQ